jgi:hypothetical protein
MAIVFAAPGFTAVLVVRRVVIEFSRGTIQGLNTHVRLKSIFTDDLNIIVHIIMSL